MDRHTQTFPEHENCWERGWKQSFTLKIQFLSMEFHSSVLAWLLTAERPELVVIDF